MLKWRIYILMYLTFFPIENLLLKQIKLNGSLATYYCAVFLYLTITTKILSLLKIPLIVIDAIPQSPSSRFLIDRFFEGEVKSEHVIRIIIRSSDSFLFLYFSGLSSIFIFNLNFFWNSLNDISKFIHWKSIISSDIFY